MSEITATEKKATEKRQPEKWATDNCRYFCYARVMPTKRRTNRDRRFCDVISSHVPLLFDHPPVAISRLRHRLRTLIWWHSSPVGLFIAGARSGAVSGERGGRSERETTRARSPAPVGEIESRRRAHLRLHFESGSAGGNSVNLKRGRWFPRTQSRFLRTRRLRPRCKTDVYAPSPVKT